MSHQPLERLRTVLDCLHDSLAKASTLTTTKALAEDVQAAVADLRRRDTALATALLFDSEIGLLRFIRVTRGAKEQDDAKAILCLVLAQFMLENPAAVRGYTRDIQSMCQSLFDSAKSSKCKEASFAPLAVLLDPRTDATDQAQLDVGPMFTFYFQTYVKTQSKLTASVKGAILKLLSSICRFHWKTVNDISNCYPLELHRMLLHGMDTLWGKDANFVLGEGALKGMNELMFCPVSLDIKAIFKHIKNILTMLNPKTNLTLTRYGVPAAALQLVTDHCDKFSNWIMISPEMCEDLYADLRGACTTRNNDLAKLGYRAMDSFLMTVARALTNADDVEKATKQFWWFINHVNALMNQDKGSYKDVSFAVRAYGFFAEPCRKLAAKDQLTYMVSELIKKSSFLLVADVQNRDESVYVPSFFQAYGYIAAELDVIGSEFTTAIVELAKSMLLRYPSMSSAYQGLSAAGFKILLRTLHRTGPAAKAIWSSIAYEAVLLTSTCPGSDDINAPGQFAFEDYMNFWKQLFRPTQDSCDADLDDMLYDETMRAALQLPPNLDLTLKELTPDEPSLRDEETVTVANPVDLAVLATFTKFMERFLSDVHTKRFGHWIYIMGDKWINMSLRHPFISSFLNLFSVVLKLSDSLGFFTDVLRHETRGNRETVEEELMPNATGAQKSAYMLFTSYLKGLAVRSQALKDEMLAGCLRLLLACPAELVCVRYLIDPLCTAIKLGLSFPPLADTAIEALERWVTEFPATLLRPAYKQVLPLLFDYLTLDVESLQPGPSARSKASMRKSGARFQMKGLAETRSRMAVVASMDEDNSAQLTTVRNRIVILLGKIGGDNRLLLDGQREDDKQIIAWDTEKRLSFDIPFKEINCEIYLDDILPRIVDLAESSPDRKTKVAATELLHACVILMVGRSAKTLANAGQTTEVRKSPFHKLYSKVFPALLRLGIDLDRVTQELFRPLVFQIIHWLTKNSRAENPETMAMLNACLDAISGTNGALRDFAGDCIREFVIWSIKHSSVKEQERNPVNVKSLVKRLYRLLLHTSVDKRLGGAVAFNKIYRVLREEASLIDHFSFEIMYHLLMCLRLAETDNAAYGTQRETAAAITHFTKIVKTKADVFRKVSKLRRHFPGLKTVTLEGLVEWVFGEIGRPEVGYAQHMMGMFMELAPLVSTPKQWIETRMKEDPGFIRKILEKNVRTIPRDTDFHHKRMRHWTSHFIICLNGYTFLLDAHILNSSAILSHDSALPPAISFFVEAHATNNSETAAIEDVNERLRANQQRSFAIVKTLGFLESLFQRNPAFANDTELWSPKVFSLVATCVFRPATLGFATESEDIKRHLPARMESLLKLMDKHLADKWKKLFIRCLSDLYFTEDTDVMKVDWKNPQQRTALTQSVMGLRQVQSAGVLTHLCTERGVDVPAGVYDIVVVLSKERDPMTDVVVGQMLTICLKDPGTRERCMLELMGLGSKDKYEDAKSFYQHYSSYINTFLAENFAIGAELLSRCVFNPMSNVILQSLLEFMIVNRTVNQQLAKTFMAEFVKSHELVRKIGESFDPTDLLQLWKRILRVDPKLLTHQKGNVGFVKAFCEVYISFLNPGHPLATLNEVLSVVASFTMEPTNREKIEHKLNEVIVNQFPLSPKDLDATSAQYAEYETAMQHLLKALETSDSVTMVKCLIPHVCRATDHPFADPLKRSIQIAAKAATAADMDRLMKVLLGYYRDPRLPTEIRRNVVGKTLLPLLSVAPKQVVRDAFKDQIKLLMATVADGTTPTTPNRVKDQLLDKTAAFELLDMCYTYLDTGEVHSTHGAVVTAFCNGTPKTGKELSMELIKLANSVKNEIVSDDNGDMERARRACQQAAFNALASVILATQNEKLPLFCTTFLFKENPAKRELHWGNVVDTKGDVVGLGGGETSADWSEMEFRRERGRYLSTQYLAESSLSQTTTMSLAEAPSLPSERLSLQNPNGNSNEDTSQQQSSIEHHHQTFLFHQNPCMSKIVTVVRKLHQSVSDPAADIKLPPWMQELMNKISDPTTPLNIRLFIACMVLNAPMVFQPHVLAWWNPLVRVITEYLNKVQTIDAFVQRLCAQILQWAGYGEVDEEKQKLAFKPKEETESQSVVFLMIQALLQYATTPTSMADIKRNLNLLGAFVETWPKLAVPPTNDIYRFITSHEKKDILSGVYVTALFVGNGMSPFHTIGLGAGMFTEAMFWNAFLKLIEHNRKEVYSSAAETFGRWMKLAATLNPDMAAELLEELRKKLTALNGVHGSPADQDRFVQTLASLSFAYGDIVAHFSRNLLFILPRLFGKIRARCLYALSSCAPDIPDLFNDLRAKGLLDLIQHRDEECQKLILVIMYNISPRLTSDQIAFFLPATVASFTGSASDQIRRAFYSLLQRLYDQIETTDALSSDVRAALLGGLGDANDEIRDGVVAYLNRNQQLGSTNIFDKMKTLLGFYQPEIETSYLNFTTSFMLNAAKESPQYSTNLFDSGLPDATFVEATIDTSWTGVGSMQHLFAATQSATVSSSLGLQQTQQQLQQQRAQNVRATQAMQWSLTQDLNPIQARDIFSVSESEVTGAFTATQNEERAALLHGGIAGRRPSIRAAATSSPSSSQSDDPRRHFANQAERQRRNKMRAEMVQKAARAHTITLTRKYRAGELPDIEIKTKEIIDPLQILASRDPDIAQQLLSALITSMYNRVDNYSAMNEEQAVTFKTTVETSLQKILGTSVDFSPSVIAATLRAMYQTSAEGCSSQLISRASERSSNSQMGILLLEKCVDEPRAPAAKRVRTGRGPGTNPSTETWLHLSRLYKSVKNMDVYRAVIEHHISSIPPLKDALTAESSKQYELALIKYRESMEITDIKDIERDIYHEGFGECLENLGLWDDLLFCVLQDIESDTEKLWDENFEEPYMKRFFRAHLRLWEGYTDNGIFQEWTSGNPLATFVQGAMKDPRKRHALETRYLKDLSLLHLALGDLDRSQHYSQRAIEDFLSSFGGIHPLAYEARLSKLSALQLLIEIRSFADLSKLKDGPALSHDAVTFVCDWKQRRPSLTLDSITTWEDLLLGRKLMTDRVMEQSMDDSLKDKFKLGLQQSHQLIVKAARKQHNFTVAGRYTASGTEFDPLLSYSSLKLLFTGLPYLDGQNKARYVGTMMANFAYWQAQIKTLDATQQAKYLDLEGRLLDYTWQLCLEESDFAGLLLDNKHVKKAIKKAAAQAVTDAPSFIAFGTNRAFRLFCSAVSLSPHNKRRLHLVAHCDSVLRRLEENADELVDANIDSAQYARTMIINVFEAMKDGFSPAIEIFPRLLQLLELYPSTADDFAVLSQDVQSWTFLRWLSQITALLDKPSGTALFSIVSRVAMDYPAALYFPLSISSEQYSFDSDKQSQKNKNCVEDITKLAGGGSASLLDKFKLELKRLTEPVHVFKDWLERTDALLRVEPRSPEAIVGAFEEMSIYCLASDPSMGEVGRGFAARHAVKIHKLTGRDGSKLTTMTMKDWRAVQSYYVKEVDKKEPLPSGGMVALKRYSPWLAGFTARDFEEEIEMPGQYPGFHKPRPDEHIKISSFHSEVLMMGSIRRPKRLIIIGSDEKEYPWLIKGGEDLRLDQRVQEMFSIMNSIMAQDGKCADLALRTYKVIPMSTTLGILEWVENTKPLREVLMSNPGCQEDYDRADKKHDAFVNTFAKGAAHLGDLYGNMFKQASRSKVTEHMTSMVSAEPYLKRWMHKLAASPEAFLAIRATFAKSLATISICSYLLGIGDRHLENFLIDMESGQIIGIDFGHAFGSATTILPIPELVPFRLTRQMELALKPLGVSVLLENTMINVLSCMRDKKAVLMNVLNIFIKEPLAEWRKFAIKQAQKQGRGGSELLQSTEASVHAPQWYSQQKLDIARRKLDGDNPCHITAQELEWGHGMATWFRPAREVLLATGTDSRRALIGARCGSVRDQVQCLIDQATDPNILGRAWRGWAPWC
ncbi:hypothetical protein DFJ77DRAFT_504568 [Powellomyces hirtus]|nr:hypothetical protein DFJ77DRAFT_504568 [Powellomyces hirtus]